MQTANEKMYPALVADLSKNFALDTSKAILDVENFFDTIVVKLSSQILGLIQNDYNRLLIILYRIDVDEKTVAECLGGTDVFSAADNLAKAVIKRMVQKIEYRMANL